jgi:hypothetical protein
MLLFGEVVFLVLTGLSLVGFAIALVFLAHQDFK